METSTEISALAEALAKAQGVMEGAKKDAENPFFKSKYADLESVWSACRKPLSDNGLSVIQTVSTHDSGSPMVTTMLAHSSGQWIRDSFVMIPKDGGPQSMGSVISYARRYALAAIVGVYQMDDDANAGHGRPTQSSATKKTANEIADECYAALGASDKKIVDEMRKRIEAGLGQPVVDMHADLNRDQAHYLGISSAVYPAERQAWKDILERERRERPISANGRSLRVP